MKQNLLIILILLITSQCSWAKQYHISNSSIYPYSIKFVYIDDPKVVEVLDGRNALCKPVTFEYIKASHFNILNLNTHFVIGISSFYAKPNYPFKSNGRTYLDQDLNEALAYKNFGMVFDLMRGMDCDGDGIKYIPLHEYYGYINMPSGLDLRNWDNTELDKKKLKEKEERQKQENFSKNFKYIDQILNRYF